MKKILTIILSLLIGIMIGLGVGAFAGMFFAKQQEQEELPKPSVTVTPVATAVPTRIVVPTNTPALTMTVTPTLSPELTNIPTPTPTSTPTPTNTPTPSPTPSPTPMPVWAEDLSGFYGALHVEGSQLMGEDGCLVQLRGVSTHGLGWFPEYVNENMIAQARQEWGCNVFRLAMYTAEYNGYCTSGSAQKENLKKIIDAGVQTAVAQEMYVIIDWHILSDGNPTIYKDEAKKFFAEMAQKYGDIPNVIYEICNEPNGRGDWTSIKEYAMEIIPVIRKYAPEAIIIVGTPTWSQDVDVAAKNPITGYENLMYALHFYAGTHKDSLREKCKIAVSKGLPLFVSEYGICDASGNGAIDETQANKWIELLDSYGISHVMWNLSNKAETSAMIKSSCSKTSNLAAEDLSAAGVWFLKMMGRTGAGDETWIKPTPQPAQTVSPTPKPLPSVTPAPTPEDSVVKELFELPDNMELVVSGNWPVGDGQAYQLNVIIKNNGASEEVDWTREIRIKAGQTVTISQSWCARVTREDANIILKPEDYNRIVPAGGEVTGIGIIVEVK